MPFLLVFIGLLLFAPSAQAQAPASSEFISVYPYKIVEAAQQRLSALGGAGGSNCGSEIEKKIIERMRAMLRDSQTGFTAPQEDIARSVCHVNDIQVLERYVQGLMGKAIISARACNAEDAEIYIGTVAFVWGHISDLRRYGLDPKIQKPISGPILQTVPPNAQPDSDDGRCPYNSRYAQMDFANVGCQYDTSLPSSMEIGLKNELKLQKRILLRMWKYNNDQHGLSAELQFFRNAITSIHNSKNAFVNYLSQSPVYPPSSNPLVFTPYTVPNVGESGCLGWPSDVTGGLVTGEDIPLKNYFPFVLTNELAEMIAFIEEQEGVSQYEYVRSVQEETSGRNLLEDSFLSSVAPDITRKNREHLRRESSNIFSLREPQKRYEQLANSLHDRTEQFVLQVVTSSDSHLPPLRKFIRNYATFLARMCQNRGCKHNLIRAAELSMRNECFSAFLQDRFFIESTGGSTLKACQAIYTYPP